MVNRMAARVWSALVIVALAGALAAPGAVGRSVQTTDGDLQAMLGLVPATFPHLDDPELATISYANIAAQLEAVDVTAPGRMDDDAFSEWFAATLGLPVPSHAAQYLQSWREDYGFDLPQADQTLQISLAPFDLSLFRGRFDEQEIVRTLRELGYKPVSNDWPILAIRDDYEQDISAQTAYKFAAMNYATILDDGTLAFASAQATLESVLDVVAGDAPSLAERSDIAELLPNVPDGLASALLVDGVMLTGGVPEELLELDPEATPDIEAIATEMAEGSDMPPVVTAMLGTTVGGPLQLDDETAPLSSDVPAARAVIVVVMQSPDAAKTAAPVIEERLATAASSATDQPYAELFPERSVEVVPETPVVRIDLTLGEGTQRNILMQMLFNRDLGFLAW